MAISVGDTVPDVKIMTVGADGPAPAQTTEVLGSGKVVLFAVPGAFTPTCSEQHLPGFVTRADDLKAKGVDKIACISVNDPFVMGAWGQAAGGDDVEMLADGNGDFATAVGLTMDGSGFGLGTRSQRYAMVLDGGKVSWLGVEEGPGLDKSSVDSVLAAL